MHMLSLLAGAALVCLVIGIFVSVRQRFHASKHASAGEAQAVTGDRPQAWVVRAVPIYVDGLMVAELMGARFTFTARSTTVRARTVIPVTGMDTDLVTLVRNARRVQVACPLGDDFLASAGLFTMAEIVSEERTGTLNGEFTFEGDRATSTERTNEICADPAKLGPSGYTSVTVHGRNVDRERFAGRWPKDIAKGDDVRPLVLRDCVVQTAEEATDKARRRYEENAPSAQGAAAIAAPN